MLEILERLERLEMLRTLGILGILGMLGMLGMRAMLAMVAMLRSQNHMRIRLHGIVMEVCHICQPRGYLASRHSIPPTFPTHQPLWERTRRSRGQKATLII